MPIVFQRKDRVCVTPLALAFMVILFVAFSLAMLAAGLGWFYKMRWGTASAYSTIFSRIEEARSVNHLASSFKPVPFQDMAEVEFPFMIVHDPKDGLMKHVQLLLLQQAP